MNLICGILLSMIALGPGSSEGIWKVQVHGALREIMHQGNLSERVNLSGLAGQPGLYGLGAVADLKGEIMVLDGKAYVSQLVDGKFVIKKGDSVGAALLVTARVSQWQSVPIPASVQGLKDLAAFVQAEAKRIGLEPHRGPFPFQVKGQLKTVSWHVIDWPEGDTEHSHEKHKRAGATGDLSNSRVTLLGFFSDHHQGRFTHHSTPIHVHVRAEDGTVVGHVDKLEIGDSAVLLLPSQP